MTKVELLQALRDHLSIELVDKEVPFAGYGGEPTRQLVVRLVYTDAIERVVLSEDSVDLPMDDE